jgi:hypothetical protein
MTHSHIVVLPAPYMMLSVPRPQARGQSAGGLYGFVAAAGQVREFMH